MCIWYCTGILDYCNPSILLYCPKRVSYQYVTVIMNSNIIIIISQGYETRVKLAVLDHNAHLQRNHITKQDGTKVYHRKYRKQTKKWDVTPVLEEKKYVHTRNNGMRIQSTVSLHHKGVLSVNQPVRRQSTIAHAH